MEITQISRLLKFSVSESIKPLKDSEISVNEFKLSVKNLPLSYKEREIEGDEGRVKFITGAYIINEEKIFRYTFIHGQIRISYDGRLSDNIISGCWKIAKSLNAYVLSEKNIEYPMSKIIAADKRLALKTNIQVIEYQKESFGGNNIWLAIRSDHNKVKDFFHLEGEEKDWQIALNKMFTLDGIFTFEFKGWVFIAGQKICTLFYSHAKSEKKIEMSYVDNLLKWGETFIDIQLYMHYNRSTYLNAFYRVLNGKMHYGEYYTESYSKTYGKPSKSISNLPDNNANTIAREWSFDPDSLRYHKELKNGKAWVMNHNLNR